MAIDERRLDEQLLIFASVGRLCCVVARGFLEYLEQKLRIPLDQLIGEHFEENGFGVWADLDVPTYQDKIVQGKLEATLKSRMKPRHGCNSIGWESLSVFIDLLSATIRLVAELAVLVKVAGSQQGGISFVIVHFGRELCEFILRPDLGFSFTKGSFSDSISLDRSTFIDGFIQLGSQSLIMNIMSSLTA